MGVKDRFAIRPQTASGIEEGVSSVVQERRLNRTLGQDESGLSALLKGYRAQADKTLEENQDVQPSFGTQALIGLLPIAAGALAGAFGPKGGRGESMALGGATGAKAGLQGLETLEKGRKERKDLREKALKTSIDIQKLQSDVSKQQQDRIESGQKIDIELGKMLSQMNEANAKNDVQKKLVEASAEDFRKQKDNKIKLSLTFDETVAALDDPNISKDQKVQIALRSLGAMNSESGQNAVGVEEAQRLGNQLKLIRISAPGPMFGRQVKEFRDSLVISRNRMMKEAKQLDSLISSTVSGEKPDFSPKQVFSTPQPGTESPQLTKEQLEKLPDEELEKLYKSFGN